MRECPVFSEDVYIDQEGDRGFWGFCADVKTYEFAVFSLYLSFTLQFGKSENGYTPGINPS
jgi:hypothetical protein